MKLSKNEFNLIAALKAAVGGNTNDVFKANKSTGGQLLATAAQFIPGYGQIASPLINMVDKEYDKTMVKPDVPLMNMNKETLGNTFAKGGSIHIDPKNKGKFNETKKRTGKTTEELTHSSNPLTRKQAIFAQNAAKWKHEDGGYITNDFKQYDTGSHTSGNDLGVDENGNPSSQPTAFVQNKENTYQLGGKPYVMSDTLINPESGNYFNADASKLNSKFKAADVSVEDKNALDFGMKRLSLINDKMRNISEMVQKACGGSLKKMATGGIPGDPIRNLPYVDLHGNVIQPNNDALVTENITNNDTMVPIGNSNPLDPQVVEPGLPMDTYNPMAAFKPLSLGQDLVATAPGPNRSFKAKGKSVGPNTTGETNYNDIAVILKGAALGKSIVDAVTPAQKEDPILTNYQAADKQIYGSNIDYTQAKQDALGVANLTSNMNRSASSNFAQYQGRQGANFANLGDQISRITSAENQSRSELAMQRGQYEAGKASDNANRLSQNRVNNQMNQANADFADQKLFSELSTIGSSMNQYEETKKQIRNNQELANAKISEGLLLIGSKYQNFGFSPDFMEKIKSGKATLDEQVRFISTTSNIKKGG